MARFARKRIYYIDSLAHSPISYFFEGGLVFDVVKVKSNDTTTPWIGIYQSIRGKGKALVPKNTSLVPCGHSWGIFGTRALPLATHALVNSNPGGGNNTLQANFGISLVNTRDTFLTYSLLHVFGM